MEAWVFTGGVGGEMFTEFYTVREKSSKHSTLSWRCSWGLTGWALQDNDGDTVTLKPRVTAPPHPHLPTLQEVPSSPRITHLWKWASVIHHLLGYRNGTVLPAASTHPCPLCTPHSHRHHAQDSRWLCSLWAPEPDQPKIAIETMPLKTVTTLDALSHGSSI